MTVQTRTIQKPANDLLATRFLFNWLTIMYAIQLGMTYFAREVPYIQGFQKWNEGIWAGQWWRLITYSALHGSGWHFLLNAGALFGVGYCMEKKMRGRWIFLIFCAGIFGGGLASLYLSNLGLIGASPGIFAMCGAWFVFLLKYGDRVEKLIWGTSIVLDTALSFLPQFDLSAHLGGLATGLLLGILLFWVIKTK